MFDRVPIIIGGTDKEFVDDLIIKLCDAVSIRKEIVFGTDFIEKKEHETIIQEEKIDYDNHRIIFRAPVNSDEMILRNMDDLKGWIIGLRVNGDIDGFYERASRLRKKCQKSIFIKLSDDNSVEFVKNYSENGNKIDTSLEKQIIRKTISQTEHALERIKRVLDKKIQGNTGINSSIITSLVDLSQEASIIKENVFKKEVLEFYQASRRGLALLTRLNFLNQFYQVKIGKKTFFDAISYEDVSTSRFLDFVQSEWGESFSNLIDDSRLSVLGDHLDSLWG
jgi:hypothetical protein